VGGVDAARRRPERDGADLDSRVRRAQSHFGRHGDTCPARDQVLHRLVVVEVEGDLRLEPGRATGATGEGLTGGATRPLDPRLIREVGEGHRATTRCSVAAGQDDEERLLQEESQLHALFLREGYEVVLVEEGDVQLARLEPPQRDERIGFGHGHLDSRMPAAQKIDGGERDGRGGRRERGEPDRARPGLVGERAQLVLGLRDAGEDVVGARDESKAGLCEANTARAAVQQKHAHLSLELGELLRNRRGRKRQRLCRRGDGAPAVDLTEQAQPADVEHKRSLPSARQRRMVGCRRGWQRPG
jgi:hypothetical protein